MTTVEDLARAPVLGEEMDERKKATRPGKKGR